MTIAEVHILSKRLLEFCRHNLVRYDGYYSAELSGKIARIVRRAGELQDLGLLDIDRDFLPDDLHAAMPWACKPEYFDASGFKRIPVPQNLSVASRQPFAALGIGIDAVCSGPSAGLTVPDILAVLDLLEGRRNDPTLAMSHSDTRIKTVIPSVVGGFQGVTIANFVNLSDTAQYRVFNHLHQFGETIGHKCEEIRQRRAKQLLENHNGVEEVARAFVTILPPIEYVIATKGTANIGLELMREHGYWAGYHPMSKDRLRSLRDGEEAEGILAHINGEAFRLQVKLVGDLPSLDPVLTRLRMKSNMASITSSLDHAANRTFLRRNDLFKVHESLERQIAEGIKVQSACKALYVVDAILKNYEDGEARIHNSGGRAFITRKLGEPAKGYQVAGKSSDKLIKDINKLIQGVQFETPTNAILRATWRPADNQTY